MALLKLFCVIFITAALFIPAVMAQPVEMEQESSVREILSYATLCKAIYWQRMGDQNTRGSRKYLKNYRNAGEQLKEAILLDSQSSYLYTRMAEVSFVLQDARKAVSVSKKAIELNPDNADAHYWLGMTNLSIRREREGIRELEKATELEPGHLDAQLRLAYMLLNNESYEGAARAYSEVVKAIPYNPRYRNQLGFSYMKIGEIEEAINEFNAAIRLGSNELKPYYYLAFLYARQSRNREAIEKCLFILKHAPGDEDTTLLLGELYVAMGEFDKAIEKLERLPRLRRIEKQKRADAYYKLAIAHKGKGDTALAELNFQKSIDIYDDILDKEEDFRYYLAMVYDAKGDMPKAEKYLREYISLGPDDSGSYTHLTDAYNFLGYMLVENDVKLEEAVELIEKAVAEEPENGAFRDSLGWAHFKLGDLDGAISELEKAAELIPDDSEVRIHLGEAYRKKGGESTVKAVEQWEKALEIKPTDTALQQRLEELSKSLE